MSVMYVHISPSLTCAAQTLRCAEHIEAAAADPQRLLDAIRCGHLALMAALTEALSGSAGIGAFKDGSAVEHLKFMRGERPDMPGEWVLPFSDLFARVQEPGRLEFSPPLTFTADEAQAVAEEAAFGKPFNQMLQSLRVAVIGLGGTGSPVATLLARSGVGELVLIDGDRLEASNLNRVRGYRRRFGGSTIWSAVGKARRALGHSRAPLLTSALPLSWTWSARFGEWAPTFARTMSGSISSISASTAICRSQTTIAFAAAPADCGRKPKETIGSGCPRWGGYVDPRPRLALAVAAICGRITGGWTAAESFVARPIPRDRTPGANPSE
jgi:hypothetical protein